MEIFQQHPHHKVILVDMEIAMVLELVVAAVVLVVLVKVLLALIQQEQQVMVV